MKLLFIIFLFNNLIFCQDSFHSAFGNAENNEGKLSFSVGQVFFQNVSNNSNSITNGVHSIVKVSSLSTNSKNSQIKLSVYPNPTSNFLNLSIQNYANETYNYEIFSLTGKLIKKGNVNKQNTIIDTSNLEASIYYLFISSQSKRIASFKILKD